jgi:hypothetical protein
MNYANEAWSHMVTTYSESVSILFCRSRRSMHRALWCAFWKALLVVLILGNPSLSDFHNSDISRSISAGSFFESEQN